MFGNILGPAGKNCHTYSYSNNSVMKTGNVSFTKDDYVRAVGNSDCRDLAASIIIDAEIDKLILAITFECHRLSSACDVKMLTTFFEKSELISQTTNHELNLEKNGLDIFGNKVSNNKVYKIECPVCHKPGYDASKLTAHLESHFELKRSSSIEARKRIYSSQVKEKDEEDEWNNKKEEKMNKRNSNNENKRKKKNNKKQKVNNFNNNNVDNYGL